ncbi:prepilin-type N-terminal cleavage/methylation domain-containing protein [Paragemmobacter straminiformis]|uniref:Prepilin-type N-terminal cleavage/methylation domain-containing protein n=1 Tax=Paragemmobacter straminiformis TaxID=2045119 RepID=A0A842I9L8_9RHOB|nr:prepilin-type N-terminal cleavage/methylation domain-containing protein [Gemmobacter straminiformis]
MPTARNTAPISPRPPAASPCGPSAEQGFSLVEVLAALALSTMMLVAAFDTFATFARVADRQARSTAARNLARVLLAEGSAGQGDVRGLVWQADTQRLSQNLARRDLAIRGPNGPVLSLSVLELPQAAP